LIQAFLSPSSKESNGLFQILHPHVHANLTFQYFNNQSGIRSIDALIFVALGEVRSK
jgi:hypothetical protein